MKACITCNTVKPLSDYYAHPGMTDGTLNSCKECVKARARENRARKIDYYREYDRKRANDPDRVLARNEYAKTRRGAAAHGAAKRRYVERNPIKRAAHVMVGNAIRSGQLVRQPCEVCQADIDIHGHHDDYAHPLVVRWLCVTHHVEWHKNNKPLFGGQPIEDSEWEH